MVSPCLREISRTKFSGLADEYGLEYWVALGKIDLGWADAELGNALLGIEEIQEGLAAYEATGGKLWSPRFLGLYAVALGKAGRFEESLAVIAKALDVRGANRGGIRHSQIYIGSKASYS